MDLCIHQTKLNPSAAICCVKLSRQFERIAKGQHSQIVAFQSDLTERFNQRQGIHVALVIKLKHPGERDSAGRGTVKCYLEIQTVRHKIRNPMQY